MYGGTTAPLAARAPLKSLNKRKKRNNEAKTLFLAREKDGNII